MQSHFMNRSGVRSSTRTRQARMLVLAAGCSAACASLAAAQDFQFMALPAGTREIRPVGISKTSGGVVISCRAINEKGVQLVETPMLWSGDVFVSMPHPPGPGGVYEDYENVMFKPSGLRAEVIPGVDIIVKTKPGGKAAVWDTRGGGEGEVFELPNNLTQHSWPNSMNHDGSKIVGAVHGDLDGQGPSSHAAIWTNFGAASLLPVPAGTRHSEVWGTSDSSGKACGAISEQGLPSDEPKKKPTGAKGIIWSPGGGTTVVEPSIAGPEATSLVFTSINDIGICAGSISTTRSNTKGGLYYEESGNFIILDAGDLNHDGTIDLFDDHDSAVNAMSADASIIGGSITLPGGTERAAIWVTWGGEYVQYDLAEYLVGLGSTGTDSPPYLTAVTGITDDGLTLTGYGTTESGQVTGWVVSIPSPGALPLLASAGLLSGRRRRS